IQQRHDGYEIDTATDRIDGDRVFHWLADESYWAMGRSAELIARSIQNSRCYGVYDPAGSQVGFARVVSDDAPFAWLCDVFIAKEARGLGLGTWLAQYVVDDVRGRGVNRLLLATKDAHGVYEKVGFVPLGNPGRWMEVDQRPVARDLNNT